MGQKVCPIGLRIGIVQDWRSRWYADKATFGKLLVEDQKIRKWVKKHYHYAGIPKIEIERTLEEVRVTLHTARPGIIIGRKGAEVDRLRDEIESLVGRTIAINIKEVEKPEIDAQLVSESVAEQLEKRASFKRTMKKAVEMAMDMGAEGIKIQVSGRLGGSEMARTQYEISGKIPLHTLQADIDYGFSEAKTTYGHIGVKVWIYKGRIEKTMKEEKPDAADAPTGEVPQEPAGEDEGKGHQRQ